MQGKVKVNKCNSSAPGRTAAAGNGAELLQTKKSLIIK